MDFKIHHRSINAIIRAANKQGLYKPATPWTSDEDAILMEYYLVEGEQSFTRVPNHSVYACRSRVLKLDLTKRTPWTTAEDEVLRKYYPKEGPKCFSRFLNRSEGSCKSRVAILGLSMEVRPTGVLWTEKENLIIKTYYPTEGSAVVSRLPNRTSATIKRQARVLGVKYIGPKRHTGQKRVKCIETGEVYNSAKEAAITFNISYKMIQACATGTKKSGGSYHWEYVD
jgi:hypothetical protein